MSKVMIYNFLDEDFGVSGSFIGPDGEIVGRFNIIRPTDPTELVTWINDLPYS